MVCGRAGIACNGTADPIQCPRVVPLLVGYDAEKVQRIRVVRLRGKNLAV